MAVDYGEVKEICVDFAVWVRVLLVSSVAICSVCTATTRVDLSFIVQEPYLRVVIARGVDFVVKISLSVTLWLLSVFVAQWETAINLFVWRSKVSV